MTVLSPTTRDAYANEMMKVVPKGTHGSIRISVLLNDLSKNGKSDREIWLATLWNLLSIGKLEMTEKKTIRLSSNERDRKK